MTRRSEFRANCAQERQLTKAEFARQYTRSREEQSGGRSLLWGVLGYIAFVAICLALVRHGG